MKAQDWIFSVRYWTHRPEFPPVVDRWAVVGPGRASTVEAALHLAKVPEEIRAEIRADTIVRDFVDGKLDRDKTGYYLQNDDIVADRQSSWLVCIGPVHEVLR